MSVDNRDGDRANLTTMMMMSSQLMSSRSRSQAGAELTSALFQVTKRLPRIGQNAPIELSKGNFKMSHGYFRTFSISLIFFQILDQIQVELRPPQGNAVNSCGHHRGHQL